MISPETTYEMQEWDEEFNKKYPQFSYGNEEKQQIIKLYVSGVPQNEICNLTGITKFMVTRTIVEYCKYKILQIK